MEYQVVLVLHTGHHSGLTLVGCASVWGCEAMGDSGDSGDLGDSSATASSLES